MATLEFVLRAVDEASAQLEATSRSLRRVADAAREAQASWQQAAEVIGRAGKAMAAAGAAVGTAMGAVVRSTVLYADQIDRASKQTGIAAEEMQRLGYAARQEHASLEALTNGLRFLARHMADAATGNREAERTFAALGVAVKNADGSLRPVNDVLLEVADRFRNTSDATLKAEMATRLFGRAGAELIPFLNQGAQAIRAAGQEADRLGLVLSSNTVAAGKQLSDAFTRLRSAASGFTMQIGQALLPTVNQLIALATRVVMALTQWASRNQGLVATLGLAAGAAAAVLVPLGSMLAVLPTLVRGWQLLTSGLHALVAVLRLATTGALSFLAAWGPWLALAAAIGAAVYVITRNLDQLAKVAAGVGRVFGGLGQILIGALSLDWNRVRSGWDQVVSGVSQVRDALATAAGRIASDVQGAFARVREALRLPELPQLPAHVDAAAGQIAGPAMRMSELLRRPGRAAKETAQDVIDATNLINGVLVERGRMWEGFASEAVRALGWLGQSTRATLQAAAEVVRAETQRLAADLAAAIADLTNTLVPALQRQGQAWQGLASEASRAAGWMGQSTRDSAAAAQQALQQWEQFHSRRLQQMQQELEMGRITREQYIQSLQQLLAAESLTVAQREQLERTLLEAQRAAVNERVALARHEVEMGRMAMSEYVRLVTEVMNAATTTTQERIRLENELVNAVVAAAQQRAAALKRETEQGQLSLEEWRRIVEELAKAWGLGADQIRAALHKIGESVRQTVSQTVPELQKLQQTITQQLQKAFEDFFTAVITGSKSVGDALSQLGTQIGQVLVRMIVEQLAQIVAKWLATAIASIWGSLIATYGIFAPLFVGVALALIAWATGLIKLAQGGIVTRPTLGLIGEAGPEAVIPLRKLDRVMGAAGADDLEQHLERIERTLRERLPKPRPMGVQRLSFLALDTELALRAGARVAATVVP